MTGGEANKADSRESKPSKTSPGLIVEDMYEQSANSSKENDITEDLTRTPGRPSIECVEDLTSRDLLNRITPKGPPRQVFQHGPLRPSEEEAAGLDLPSIEFEFGGSLRASVRDLISRIMGSIRKAYEGRIKAELEAEWGQTVRKWLQGQQSDQKLTLEAEFDARYRHQWEIENVPTMQKQLASRAEVSYHKSREFREKQAEERWAQEDYPHFLHEKKAEVRQKLEAELRQEFEKGVVAALRAEHMGQLREEAGRQITKEMMEQMREEARHDIIDDKARYDRNAIFARDLSSKIPADAAPGISGGGLFGIYHPVPGARSETGDFPRPTRIPGRAIDCRSGSASSGRTDDMSQSNECHSRQPPFLAPALFERPTSAKISDNVTMIPHPSPSEGIAPQRNPLSGINAATGQAKNKSALEDPSDAIFQRPPEAPMAEVCPAGRPFIEQLKIDLHEIQTQRAEAALARSELRSNTIREARNQAQVQTNQVQHFLAAPDTRVLPAWKAGKKRARSNEREAADEDPGEDKENRIITPRKLVTKRPRVERTPQGRRISTRSQAAIQRAATDATETEAIDWKMIAAAAPRSSGPQPSQPGSNVSKKPITRSNRSKRDRHVEEPEMKEEDETSPPPAKRARRVTAKCNYRGRRRYPHECKHLGTDLRFDIYRVDGTVDGFPEDEEHDRCDDGCHTYREGSEKSEDRKRERSPASVDGEWCEDNGGNGKAGTGQEKAKHPVRGFANKIKSIGDIRWKGNWNRNSAGPSMEEAEKGQLTSGASKQLVQHDLYGIEPIHLPRLAAVGDLVSIALAEVPKSDLVEIMQSESPCDAVDENRIWHGSRNNVAQIQLDEVDGGQDRMAGIYIADLDKDNEDERYKKEEGGEEGEDAPGTGRAADDIRIGECIWRRSVSSHVGGRTNTLPTTGYLSTSIPNLGGDIVPTGAGVSYQSLTSTTTLSSGSLSGETALLATTIAVANGSAVSGLTSSPISSGSSTSFTILEGSPTTTLAVNNGIRMLQGQTHLVNGTVYYCHSSCDLLNAGTAESHFADITRWVRRHPYDVVTLLIGNGDLVNVNNYIAPLQSSGLVKYAYTPPEVPMGLDDWPTLSELILMQKRVVIFMDYNANHSSVPYVLDEFSHMWETPFSPTNRSFPCTQQRPPDLSTEEAKQRMYLANHNLNTEITLAGNSILVPTAPLLNETNNVTGPGSLGAMAEECEGMLDL
ncbi:MAG: hypothetical protein Q9216_001276 [Gyalolechia sp. 2 TL-2023]